MHCSLSHSLPLSIYLFAELNRNFSLCLTTKQVLFHQIIRLLKSPLVVTFSTLPLILWIQIRLEFQWIDIFLGVNQWTKPSDSKAKTNFKDFTLFWNNWILRNVSILLSRVISVLPREASGADTNTEASCSRRSTDQLFLHSTEDKTCRDTKQI